jgi:GNAT superfamily N-acetyltransferase
MAYMFRSPESKSEWTAYHDIRRTVLWEARGIFDVYDDDHPDEFKPNHFPKLLIHDDVPIGVIRIDIYGATAWFRRVAIIEARQRNGHGRSLLDFAEDFAREYGAQRVESSVDEDAVPFYRRCGYASPEGQPETAMFKRL